MRRAEDILNTYYTFVSDLEGVTPELNREDLVGVIKIVQREAIADTCIYVSNRMRSYIDEEIAMSCIEDLKKKIE